MFRSLLDRLGKRRETDELEQAAVRILGDAQTCDVLRLIMESPGIGSDDLTFRTGVEKGVIERCLKQLIDERLVVLEMTGYYVTEESKPAVVRHLPLNYQCPGMLRK